MRSKTEVQNDQKMTRFSGSNVYIRGV